MWTPKLLLIALLIVSAETAPAQEISNPAPRSGERLVSQVEFLFRGAARPAWSQQGDWVAYDKRGSDGYNDLYIARPDNAFDRCLTCELNQFNRQHAGNAAWHPSGRYIVFQTERPFRESGEPYPFLAIPGRNRESGIWVISPDGEDAFQLVGQREGAFPVHGPRFSFEGGQLAWSERVASSGTWGDWVMRVGEVTSGRAPRLRNVGGFDPAAQKAFYEISSFTPDDNGLLFSGNLIEGQPVDGLDLYTLELDSEYVQQLTKNLERWDRFAALAPDGRTLAWSSAEGMRQPERPLSRGDRQAIVQLDLWISALDGSWSRRLTGFNDALSEEYLGTVMVGPSVWSPTGNQILTTVTPLDDPGHSDLFLVTLTEAFGVESPLLQ